MSKNLVSWSRRLEKSTSSNIGVERRIRDFQAFILPAKGASLSRKYISRTFHSYDIGPYIKIY